MGLETLLRSSAAITSGIRQNRLAKQSADRIRAIGEADARLRSQQAAQLLGAQRVSRAAQGVTGTTVLDVASQTQELEFEDVERFRFAAEAQADQTERQGRAQLFGNLLGLSSVFVEEVDRRKKLKETAELRRLVDTAARRNTAIGQGVRTFGDG